jgi:hypothetical protein
VSGTTLSYTGGVVIGPAHSALMAAITYGEAAFDVLRSALIRDDNDEPHIGALNVEQACANALTCLQRLDDAHAAAEEARDGVLERLWRFVAAPTDPAQIVAQQIIRTRYRILDSNDARWLRMQQALIRRDLEAIRAVVVGPAEESGFTDEQIEGLGLAYLRMMVPEDQREVLAYRYELKRALGLHSSLRTLLAQVERV